MTKEIVATNKLDSPAEELFYELFSDIYGPEKTKYLFTQYSTVDIYGNRRLIDFVLESDSIKIAIEIDGETYHNPKNISDNKYYEDLLKQNSLIYDDWKVYRWAYNQQDAIDNLSQMRKEGDSIALLYHATGERVIIVMGAVCVIKSRVSGTLNKYISCIA